MPNIAKEPLHHKANNMIFGERFIIKGHLQYRHRLDRFLSTDLIQKAYSHNKDITSEKFSDNGNEKINTTGQQQSRHHSLQQDKHSERHQESQHRLHQDKHSERHFGNIFFNEIIYLPLA